MEHHPGHYPAALDYFERALTYTPNYSILETNLGVVNAALRRPKEAEKHFRRAVQLAPQEASPHFFYARWLREQGRRPEAIEELKTALAVNPSYMDARYLLMQAYTDARQFAPLQALVADTLKLAPNDAQALSFRGAEKRYGGLPPVPVVAAAAPKTAEDYVNLSLRQFQARRFQDSITSAREALKLRPDYPEAYNNIAAAYGELGRWDEAVAAAREAVRLKPDFPLARNNLAWVESQKKLHAAGAK